MALQALALYSTRVFSRGGASTVTVRSPSGDRCLFHVNQNNKLLYQERVLQDTEGKYSIEVQGSACASVQVSEYTSLLQSCGAICTLIHITGKLFLLAHKMFVFGQDGFPDFLFSIPGGAPLQRPYSYQKHNAQYPGDSRDGLQQEVFETQSHAEAPVSVRMKDKFV